MTACPHCGSERWQAIHDAYEVEVRRQDPDLDLLQQLAPPTRRASIHGFILGLLVWILILVPFFASARALLRDTSVTLAFVLVWGWIFSRARKKDAVLKARYETRQRCADCGREGDSAPS